MEKKRKPGRPPKSPGEPKRDHLWFRVRDELKEILGDAARANGRSVSEEAERWLEHWSDVRSLIGEAVDAAEIKEFGTYVREMKRALIQAGEDPDLWREYVGAVPLSFNLQIDIEREKLAALVFCAVDDRLEEYDRYIEQHGEPRPDDAPALKSKGLSRDERNQAVMQDSLHRYYARKRQQIRGNRLAVSAQKQLSELLRDERYRDKTHPEHKKVAIDVSRLRTAIESAANLSAPPEE